ncbi:MarR family transcriptional regulator [Actinomycetospora corticicola]|jgi:DNA-binding MarR family transcriptional regulator|uniref:DNA-binding MarR family transcriptional regulator n=1 Tax=Actinomycetospora corticicola TaxID=663602 RepID=A0A7Y9J4Y7_9PSEU|nr:MarR family transcriptional regulator [Actinomycetospora corticicola]NYD35603.1 DNA-binding MarR family transcriptional regulator [Actinomycetospora corticicola]
MATTSSDLAASPMGVGERTDPHDPMLPARLRLAVGRLNRRIRVDSGAVLPPLQTSVLVTLEEHEPLRLSELARREAVTPPTMSRVLAALDDAGLLVRTPDPQDARSALVELSADGRAMIERLRTERTAMLAERLERLPEDQREALAAALPALEALVALPSS